MSGQATAGSGADMARPAEATPRDAKTGGIRLYIRMDIPFCLRSLDTRVAERAARPRLFLDGYRERLMFLGRGGGAHAGATSAAEPPPPGGAR